MQGVMLVERELDLPGVGLGGLSFCSALVVQGVLLVERELDLPGASGRAELLLGHGFGRISRLVRCLQLGLWRYAK